MGKLRDRGTISGTRKGSGRIEKVKELIWRCEGTEDKDKSGPERFLLFPAPRYDQVKPDIFPCSS